MYGLLARTSSAASIAMQMFIARENLKRFQALLLTETSPRLRQTLKSMIAATRRELAILEADAAGAQTSATAHAIVRGGPHPADGAMSQYQKAFEASERRYMLIDPRPGLHIVDITDAYAEATLVQRGSAAGRPLFEVFPDNPDDPTADGVSALHGSLKRAWETARKDVMPTQRYDVRDQSGQFVVRYWQPSNTPIFNADGRLIHILHEAQDVTDLILARRADGTEETP